MEELNLIPKENRYNYLHPHIFDFKQWYLKYLWWYDGYARYHITGQMDRLMQMAGIVEYMDSYYGLMPIDLVLYPEFEKRIKDHTNTKNDEYEQLFQVTWDVKPVSNFI